MADIQCDTHGWKDPPGFGGIVPLSPAVRLVQTDAPRGEKRYLPPSPLSKGACRDLSTVLMLATVERSPGMESHYILEKTGAIENRSISLFLEQRNKRKELLLSLKQML
jgi:hypothetical protein